MLRYQDIIETLATGVIVQFDEVVSMRIAWWGIADYSVSDSNTSGMVRTNKVDVLLSVPSADVQEWSLLSMDPGTGADERWDCVPIRGPSTGTHNRPRCEGYPSAVIATCA